MDHSNMRIVLLNTFDIMGGAAKAVLRLHQGLNRIGVRHNFLVARKDSNAPDITTVRANNAEEREEWTRLEADVRAEEASYPNLRLSGYAPFHSERAARSLLLERRLRRMRLHEAEIVNLHWTRGLVDWGTFLASRSPSQAVIWTLHDENPLTGGCHYSGGCDKASNNCGACPVLESENSSDLSATVLKRKRIALDAFPGTLSLVAPSHWMARRAAASSLFRNHQIDVIPNGIDTGLFKPQPAERSQHGIASTDMVVLFVANRLDDPRKGYHHLRDALNSLQPRNDLVLVTAGDGEVVPPRHVRTIHLGGLEGEPALREAYALANIVVVPSAQDNLPNCCLEAMACGKPVLAYPTGGLPDMVLDGETGVLSTEATPASLAQALFHCLETPDALAAMGQRGRERVLKNFSLDLQARRYMNLYETAHRKATASGPQRRIPDDAERHACLLAITQAYGGLLPVTLGVWDFLLRLQADRDIRGHALEIGVFQGAAAAALSWHLRPDERYCGIDIHLQTALIRSNVAKLAPEAVDRLDLIESSSAGMVRDDLSAAFRGNCRFLHVDGEHSYPAVRRDLDLCLSAMAEDGIIAVDDFANPESVCVAHAVFDHLRDNPHRLRLFLCGGNKAYLCAPAALNAYRRACMESLVPYLERHSKCKIRLAKNSYAWEVDYLSFLDRGDGMPYMEIGKYVQELST